MRSKLSDICEYAKEKIKISALDENTYISTENMLPNKSGITQAASLPTQEQTQAFVKNDVLVSNIRPYFKKIWYATFDGGCSNDVLVFRAKGGINSQFLHYALADDSFFNYAMVTSRGTKMPRGDKKAIMEYEVSKFSYEDQNKVVNILKSLDDKIELNNKINKNLLQQAIAIFSQSFGDYPKNGCLGNYCTVKSGYAFKSLWWRDSGVKVIKIGSIKQDVLDLTVCSHVSSDKIDLASDFLVQGGDLLIAMTGATIGKFAMVPFSDESILVNQRVGKFFLGSNPLRRLPFIYCQLKQPDIYNEVVNRGGGSAQSNISAADIMSIPCSLPSEDAISSFNDSISPMFAIIIQNQKENLCLAHLRDALLLQLMSGKIDVSNLTI